MKVNEIFVSISQDFIIIFSGKSIIWSLLYRILENLIENEHWNNPIA